MFKSITNKDYFNFKIFIMKQKNDLTFISKNNIFDSSKNIKAKACLVSKENANFFLKIL